LVKAKNCDSGIQLIWVTGENEVFILPGSMTSRQLTGKTEVYHHAEAVTRGSDLSLSKDWESSEHDR
jgi:hypothetical protein